MRLGFVTPLDPQSTGVADYSLDLLPHLARHAHDLIRVFGPDDDSDLAAGDGWLRFSIADLPRSFSELDLLIYQMGNSPAHDFMASCLFEFPGIVVLHDLSLHDFFARQATEAKRPAPYFRACGFGYNAEGTALARRYLQQPMPVDYPQYLISEQLAVRSPGVIIHSRHAAEVLLARCPSIRTWTVSMPVPLPSLQSPQRARADLGVASDTYLIMVFGMLGWGKHPSAILDALKQLCSTNIPARVVFIGKEIDSFRLASEVQRRGLDAEVIQLGFVDSSEAQRWMFAADIAIGLRRLYFGETSASVLRILATATPVIVTAIGAFAELPDAACVKIPHGDLDVTQSLYTALVRLFFDPDRRRSMAQAARAYVAQEHDPDKIAIHYLRIANEMLNTL